MVPQNDAGGDEPEWYRVEVKDMTWTVPVRYTDLELIGIGAQGAVCAANDAVKGEKVAIKRFMRPFRNIADAKRTYREVKLMIMLDHPNVSNLVRDCTSDLTELYVVMDLMDGDLEKVTRMALDHNRLSYLLFQMLRGVRHMHAAGVIHRDLKPTNIAARMNCTIKILDFGLARTNAPSFSMTDYVVTRYYRAPEVILGMGYGEKVDVWSIGCIFAELILHRIVFPGVDRMDQWAKITQLLGRPDQGLLQKLAAPVRTFVLSKPGHRAKSMEEIFPDNLFPADVTEPNYQSLTRDNARDLLSKMLKMDPSERVSVAEALNHPYVSLWHRQDDPDPQPPVQCYDDDIEQMDKTVPQWKELMYDVIQTAGAVRTNGQNDENVVVDDDGMNA